jgi:hypothetical protein
MIEKFSYALSVLALLLVVGIIDDKQYTVTFFEAKLLKK